MKRLTSLALVYLLALTVCAQNPTFRGLNATPSSGGFTPFDVSFNFRSTCGFVTDGWGQQCVLRTDVYPVTNTINGVSVTYGWVLLSNSVFDVDRNSGNDVRLAGINYTSGFDGSAILSNTYFRVDTLSAGTYSFHEAIGDSFAQINQRVEIRDTTALPSSGSFVVSAANTAANHYLDASGADLTNATWPGSEAAKTGVVLATTQIRVYVGSLTTADVTTLAHFRVVRTA